jgi:hypothetical protein
VLSQKVQTHASRLVDIPHLQAIVPHIQRCFLAIVLPGSAPLIIRPAPSSILPPCVAPAILRPPIIRPPPSSIVPPCVAPAIVRPAITRPAPPSVARTSCSRAASTIRPTITSTTAMGRSRPLLVRAQLNSNRRVCGGSKCVLRRHNARGGTKHRRCCGRRHQARCRRCCGKLRRLRCRCGVCTWRLCTQRVLRSSIRGSTTTNTY